VRQEGSPAPNAMLVRGRDLPANFTLTEPPYDTDAVEGEGRHAQLLRRLHEALAKALVKALF